MRRNRPSVARAELLRKYSLARTLLAAVTLSSAVVVGALVVMYPTVATAVVAATALSWVLSAVVLRVQVHRRPTRRVAMVRVPFTDLHLEV